MATYCAWGQYSVGVGEPDPEFYPAAHDEATVAARPAAVVSIVTSPTIRYPCPYRRSLLAPKGFSTDLW